MDNTENKRKYLYSTDPEIYFGKEELLRAYNALEVDPDEQKTEIDEDVWNWGATCCSEDWETLFEGANDIEGILGIGNLDLWNGRPHIVFYAKTPKEAIKRPCGRDIMDIDLYWEDEESPLCGAYHHHDGSNFFEFYSLTKKGKAKLREIGYFENSGDPSDFAKILESKHRNEYIVPLTHKILFC